MKPDSVNVSENACPFICVRTSECACVCVCVCVWVRVLVQQRLRVESLLIRVLLRTSRSLIFVT